MEVGSLLQIGSCSRQQMSAEFQAWPSPSSQRTGLSGGGSAVHEIRRLGPREALITFATLPLCSHSSPARPYLVVPGVISDVRMH